MSLVVRTVSERVFEVVRGQIVTGKLPPELPIREDSLAAELGGGKIALREALARLEQEGLLTNQVHRGWRLPTSVMSSRCWRRTSRRRSTI